MKVVILHAFILRSRGQENGTRDQVAARRHASDGAASGGAWLQCLERLLAEPRFLPRRFPGTALLLARPLENRLARVLKIWIRGVVVVVSNRGLGEIINCGQRCATATYRRFLRRSDALFMLA